MHISIQLSLCEDVWILENPGPSRPACPSSPGHSKATQQHFGNNIYTVETPITHTPDNP